MSVLKSQLNTRSAEFKANALAMRAITDELRQLTAKIARGGSDEARAKHLARGKLLAHDRVEQLLDPGAPLLELSPLAALGMYGDEVPSAGVVTGIGEVRGVECMIIANDATVKGGSY